MSHFVAVVATIQNGEFQVANCELGKLYVYDISSLECDFPAGTWHRGKTQQGKIGDADPDTEITYRTVLSVIDLDDPKHVVDVAKVVGHLYMMHTCKMARTARAS